ncbi:MAG TPA: substrate-binding domain-containing protein [Rubrobacteraceae bacterium]|nr:substrate-binding domain-containing protein [Rubrobacteraceae bacterium]
MAAELGVSPATVSNAYNRPDQLSIELRGKVFETARRMGYTGPDPAARSLRRRRAGAIGVLYTDRLSYAFADPVSVMFLEGIAIAAEEAGLGMLLIPGGALRERDLGAIGNAVVDGFVIYCVAENDPLAAAALERQLPTVLVDQPEIDGMPSVGIDDEGSARAAAEHLIELGHRRLGVVSFELALNAVGGIADQHRQSQATYRPSRSRLKGYASAVEEAGLSWEEVPVYECFENTPLQGRIAAEYLLSREPRPTALLCLSDQLAVGVFEAARGLGLSLPEELSVVGFDDIPAAARMAPPLTTVFQPHVEKGIKAGELLIAQLRGEEPSSSELLPARLIVRGSTAPPGDTL